MFRFLTLSALIVTATAAESIEYRNDGSGSFPLVTDPPLTWDMAQGKNVLWKVPMPTAANSGPIVVGGTVITTAEPDLVIAVDANTGKESWRTVVNPIDAMPADKRAAGQELWQQGWTAILEHRKARGGSFSPEIKTLFGLINKNLKIRTPGDFGYAQATPSSDGQSVFVRFGTGAIAALGLDGKVRWLTVLPASTGGESCLLIQGFVIVLEHDYKRDLTVVALDQTNGKEVWRTANLRNPHDGFQGGGPILAKIGGQDLIICHGGEILRTKDGKILGKVAVSGNARASSPIIVGDVVYFANQPDHGGGVSGIEAFRLTSTNDAATATKLWTSEKIGIETMTSPLWTGRHAALVYIKEPGFWLFDPNTGAIANADAKLKLKIRMSMHHPSPSPCLVGGKYVYACDEFGSINVLELGAGTEVKVLGTNSLGRMGGPLFFAGTKMFARTFTELICVGK